ncbi:MAG: hypothetical protein HY909_22155 [Deltaproteobacteria bacterium]|nr:hypothetical protein [Deltaproteobacteria bacterium]
MPSHTTPSLPLPLAITLGAALTVFGPAARAQGLVRRLPGLGPTAFTVTSTSLTRYRAQNFDDNLHDDHFFSLTERLDLSATAAPWRLYVRWDGFVPWNHDTSCTTDQGCYLRSTLGDLARLAPERVSLRYQRGDLTVEAGDFYQVFGRGLALAFRKVDPIGLDGTLRGTRVELDHGRMNIRGFAGVSNPQNLDPLSLEVFSDPTDLLAGGSAVARVGADQDVELGVHVVHATFEGNRDNRRQDDVDIAGGRVEAPSLLGGDLTLYGELNIARRRTQLCRRVGADLQCDGSSVNTRPGRGIFGAVQLLRGSWTFLVEWKDYTHYLLAPTESANATPRDVARLYSAAPSLERDDQRPFTNANARGGRLRVDYNRPGSPWIFTFNSLLYGWAESSDSNNNPIDPWDDREGMVTTHSYLALRRRSRPVASPQGGPSAPAGGAAVGGAAAPAAAGLGGAGATRVSSGDYFLTASVGYRREFRRADDAAGMSPDAQRAGDLRHESLQADIDWAFPVGPQDSLELRVDHRFERNYRFTRIPGAFDWDDLVTGVRGGVALTWTHGLPLVVSASLRWDNTNRGPGSAELLTDPLGSTSPVLRQPTLYPSAELRWNFTISNFVRLFAGMTPGGRVCSGGVCRDVAPFQGALAELVLRI